MRATKIDMACRNNKQFVAREIHKHHSVKLAVCIDLLLAIKIPDVSSRIGLAAIKRKP